MAPIDGVFARCWQEDRPGREGRSGRILRGCWTFREVLVLDNVVGSSGLGGQVIFFGLLQHELRWPDAELIFKSRDASTRVSSILAPLQWIGFLEVEVPFSLLRPSFTKLGSFNFINLGSLVSSSGES